MIDTKELFSLVLTVLTVLEESGSSLFSPFSDCVVSESVRKQ
jgi:hypothetical protein